jgi:hypothetical protein
VVIEALVSRDELWSTQYGRYQREIWIAALPTVEEASQEDTNANCFDQRTRSHVLTKTGV